MQAVLHCVKRNQLIKHLESFKEPPFKSQDIGIHVMDVLRKIKQLNLFSGRNRDPFTGSGT